MTAPVPESAPQRQLFRVHGMDCAHEAALLRTELGKVAGVDALSFDLVKARMVVDGPVTADAVAAAVARTGMRAEPWSRREKEARGVLTLATALAGGALVAGIASHGLGGPAVPFFLLAIVAGMGHVLPRAWLAARHLRPDMHLLMTIAVAGAAAIGEWTEAASVAFLYSLSLALEAWSLGRARHAVEALLQLAPATAVLAKDERTVPAEEVAVGTDVLVRPGERISLDGDVVEGASHVDQSLITGESMPVLRSAGETVFAGSINGEGALVVRTTKPASETTVAHMAELVEAAGLRRSHAERWVDRFARVYTPAVLALAGLVLVAPPLLLGGLWSVWFYRALVLLVIACPCALVISTPVAIVAGLTAAARHGVLIKGGHHLETPARVVAFAFDKTGTLTRGTPQLAAVQAYDGHDDADVLARAAAIEARSEHPIARAIVQAARARGVGVPDVTDVRVHRGKGAEGRIDGKRYWVGSRRWLDEVHPDEEVERRAGELAGPGRSVVFVGNERHVCGLMSLADEVRPDARAQVEALRTAGVAHLVMLTGDNAPTAEAIAAATGVDETCAELLPEAKVEAVARLEERYGVVAMVGDGVNDAPAMARASLGIAMAATGSDAAIESADVALMTDDLSRLPWLVGHSRRTLGIIRQNVTAALAVKAAFVLLTLLGPASLWAAIAADMGVSLAVVFNSLRLLRG